MQTDCQCFKLLYQVFMSTVISYFAIVRVLITFYGLVPGSFAALGMRLFSW